MADGDAHDAVLQRFAHTGPEFGPGLSNHGPMAAEALVALGRGDAAEPWAEWYTAARRLLDHPQSRNPIHAADWREALGQVGRVGDWLAFFDRELGERPWPDVLDTWVARLAPGIMAGATHGLLRTAHAVRALDAGETRERVHELAEGLAYWAARYQELPGRAGAAGTLRVPEALARVERAGPEHSRRGMIFETVRIVETTDFAPVVNLVDTSADTGAVVSDITRTFVRQYLANARTASIAFVHTVTAPSALRMLAPHLSATTRRATLAYAWQACASIYAAYGAVAAAETPRFDEPAPWDEADLVDAAVAARDEHAIKFTEACLREHRLTPDPAFIAAARDVVVRLRAPS